MHKLTTNSQSNVHWTTASIALLQGEESFKEFLRVNSLGIDHYYKDKTLLMNEVTDKSIKVTTLLKLGADILIKDKSERQQTALHYATRSNEDVNLNIFLQELQKRNQLSEGVNIKDAAGKTSLFYACVNANEKCIDLLLNAGADPSIADDQGQLPIQVLGQRNEEFNETQRAHLEQKLMAQIEKQKQQKLSSPTSAATKPPVPPKPVQRRNSLQGNQSAAFFDQNLGPSRQKTPSPPHDGSLSRSSGSSEEAKKSPPQRTVLRRDVDQELIDACKVGNVILARELLDVHHADPNAVSQEGFTSLHIASHAGNLQLVKLLVERSANIDTIGSAKFTPLNISIEKGHTPVAIYLLEHKASPYANNKNEATPFQTAISKDNFDVVTKMTELSPNIDAIFVDFGINPLIFAASLGRLEMVKLFIKHGADPTFIGTYKNQSLSVSDAARFSGNNELVDYLDGLTVLEDQPSQTFDRSQKHSKNSSKNCAVM